jgi:phospholipase/carboxylesterase
LRQAGPLNAIEHFSNPDAKWIVLFHGYGADASDLASFAEVITTNKASNWLFPNGHLSVPIGPGWHGRAWWNIRMTELPSNWSELKPEGMDQAISLSERMMQSMKFQWKDVIIGGFSQGAMLATELFLKAPEPPAGLICMSGTLLNQAHWQSLMPNRKGSKVFLSHGENDPVLPHKGSVQLQKLFNDNQIETQFISFRGGHEIPFQVIEKMKSYLSERL